MNRRDLGALLLVTLAANTSIAVWQLRSDEPPPEFVGPPRADYTLDNYELVALDEHGRESFFAQGPLLVRDPYRRELSLTRPRFRILSDDGGYWLARAETGWVDSKGRQLRLNDTVVVDGHQPDHRRHARIETELLSLFPRERTASSDRPVTITQANSILRGRGLEADLGQRQLQLLSEVSIRHVPTRR